MKDKELIQLINQGESETLEFKTSFSKTVIETIVAFSNTKGGTIFLGISNQKEIIGVSITEETVQKWVNEVKQNTDPVIFPSFNIIRIKDKTVVSIIVNEFPLKPLSYKNRYYSRKNNSNHLLTIDEITELRFSSLSYSFDSFEVQTHFEELDKKGARIDGVYYCPHHPDKGYPKENPAYKIHCDCRKPVIKLIEKAV